MTIQEFLTQLIDDIATYKIPLTSQIRIQQDEVMTFDLNNVTFNYNDEYGEIGFHLNEEKTHE